MKIQQVTITGADDKVNHSDLIEISKKYPFVEWGILFSPKRQGSNRYPTLDWVMRFKKSVVYHNYPNMENFDKNKSLYKDNWFNEWKKSVERNDSQIQVSAHICGDYTAELLSGKNSLIKEKIQEVFTFSFLSRSQWNFNASKHEVNEDFYKFVMCGWNGNVIIQFNQANSEVCRRIIEFSPTNERIHFLYDSSGGRGTTIANYNPPINGFYTGYAGGLSPDNLQDNLEKISLVSGDKEIWIDTETGVRTDDNLDLDKVVKFLEIASKYTK